MPYVKGHSTQVWLNKWVVYVLQGSGRVLSHPRTWNSLTKDIHVLHYGKAGLKGAWLIRWTKGQDVSASAESCHLSFLTHVSPKIVEVNRWNRPLTTTYPLIHTQTCNATSFIIGYFMIFLMGNIESKKIMITVKPIIISINSLVFWVDNNAINGFFRFE